MTKVTNWDQADGFWRDPANWDNGVPNGNTDVNFVPQPYAKTITIDAPAYAHTVTVYEPLDVFLLEAPLYFSAGGGLNLYAGDFRLLSGGSINGGTLNLGSTFELLGGSLNNTAVLGTLDLSPANASVTVHNLISTPGYTLQINDTGSSSVLTFQGAQTVANATINLATPTTGNFVAPSLQFLAPSNGAAALILAASTTLNVGFTAFMSQSANSLAAIYSYGQTTISDGAELESSAHFINFGSMNFNGSTNGAGLFLTAGATTGSLINRGVITFSDSASNFVAGSGAGALFQNLGTLSGAGSIGFGEGLRFVNSGVVNANGYNALMLNTFFQDVNSGAINVSGQGGLLLHDSVQNAGGAINIYNGSVAELLGGSVLNGALTVGYGSALEATGGGASQLLGVNLTNYGLTEADDATGLTLDGGTKVNNIGTIEAMDAASLTLGATTITGGTIATDTGATATLLSNTTTTLRNVELNAGTELLQQDGNTLQLGGTITLQAANGVAAVIQTGNSITLPTAPSETWATGIGFSGVTTLEGGGVVQLGNGSAAFGTTTVGQIFANGPATLVNYDTIQGEGNISIYETVLPTGGPAYSVTNPLRLVNHGVIAANTLGQELGINVTGAINNVGGVLEATGGGQLIVNSQVVGGMIAIGAASVAFVTSAKATSITFDDTLGDTGALVLENNTSGLVASPISGFYADGLGNSDTIQFQNPLYNNSNPFSTPDPVNWTFHEAANGASGLLSITDATTHASVGSLLLAGHYLNAGASATSANSNLFSVNNFGFDVQVTTSATQSLAS